jgi:sulfhydrogenase subunit beta (sulfur reductase)
MFVFGTKGDGMAAKMDSALLARSDLGVLISLLKSEGYAVIGPTARDGAVVYEEIESEKELPVGLTDEQSGGKYRLVPSGDSAVFGYSTPVQGWKAHLFPAKQKLMTAEKAGDGFRVVAPALPSQKMALLGARACEIAAIRIQAKVFNNGVANDPGYAARKDNALVIAVACRKAGGTCFCVSQGTGPKADSGFDLRLTEIIEGARHVFLIESGSEKGSAILAKLPSQPASESEFKAAENQLKKVTSAMGRTIPVPEVTAPLLRQSLTHERWDEVAKRCLACGNCTMVCPTCFCSTVEEVNDLTGTKAERWRSWDSCFSIDYSYIHGGSIRIETKSRYRQWITHKLSYWVEQFGESGCVGCGRCITWCPVGIDITEEVRAIQATEKGR